MSNTNTSKKVAVLAVLLAVSFTIAAAGAVLAQGQSTGAKEGQGGPPSFAESKAAGSEKWILKNDNISVWFQGMKPMLKVFSTAEDGNVSGYLIKLDQIYERDGDGNKVASINLNAASLGWTKAVTETDGGLDLRVFGEVSGPGLSPTTTSAYIEFVFHLYSNSTDIKFDVNVEDWGWKSDDPENATLSLTMLLVGEKARERSNGQAVSMGKKGYVEWEKNAEAHMSNGTSNAARVRSNVSSGQDGTFVTLTFETDGGYASLSYDPTLGADSMGIPIGWGVPIAALGAAVALISRRRKASL
ncbi:MAG: hypothetical protein CVT48_01025 [Thermoplasmata archaeon HGW-Thermoplasmata-1]|nr:MAG: hypothetical protein CVT48_01025 [Thermoplasmata archaeon HGW-Thermoplasmata-1]